MTILTANPTFHALTGTQPVGQTQVATMTEHAGTVTTVTRRADTYWTVITRDVRNAFRGPWTGRGTSCAIWIDPLTMSFVVDYWDNGVCVEADRTRTLRAAIGVACTVTAARWFAAADVR